MIESLTTEAIDLLKQLIEIQGQQSLIMVGQQL